MDNELLKAIAAASPWALVAALAIYRAPSIIETVGKVSLMLKDAGDRSTGLIKEVAEVLAEAMRILKESVSQISDMTRDRSALEEDHRRVSVQYELQTKKVQVMEEQIRTLTEENRELRARITVLEQMTKTARAKPARKKKVV